MRTIVIAALLASTAAFAQQAPEDPAALKLGMGALERQRNRGFNECVGWEVKASLLAEELAKAQARIKELEPKPEAEKKAPD